MYLHLRATLRRRLGWQPVEAKLIDRKFVEHGSYNSGRDASEYQLWDYMFALPDPAADGGPHRLVIREKTFKLDLPAVGGTVPVLVNRSRTKAMFDLNDPRIDAIGRIDRRERDRRERDQARFREKLSDRGE